MFKGGLFYAVSELVIVILASLLLAFVLHNPLAALALWAGVFISDTFFAAAVYKSMMNKKNK